MKNSTFLILTCLLLLACKSDQDKLKDRALPIVREVIISDSLVYKIDSVSVFKVDTLTEKKYQLRLISKLLNIQDYYTNMIENHIQLARLHQSSAKSMQSQASLYAYLDSEFLVKEQLRQAKDKIKDADEEIIKSKIYADSAKILSKRIDLIHQKILNKTLDSVKFKGYVAWFRVKGSDKKNQELKLDSMYLYLNENMKIIPVQ